MFTIRTILHPTDFSEPARAAFRVACSLARDHQAQVLVLHVIPPPASRAEERARQGPDSYEEELWREYLLPLCASEPGAPVRPRLEKGDPAGRIVEVAREEGCDLIVLGTHGRAGLARLLLGSVAEKALRLAPCPVLTVRAPSGADRPGEAVAAAVG